MGSWYGKLITERGQNGLRRKLVRTWNKKKRTGKCQGEIFHVSMDPWFRRLIMQMKNVAENWNFVIIFNLMPCRRRNGVFGKWKRFFAVFITSFVSKGNYSNLIIRSNPKKNRYIHKNCIKLHDVTLKFSVH